MLVAIDKHAKGVFDPDDIRVLVAAFEDAWRSLADSGVSLMSDRDRDILRNELAILPSSGGGAKLAGAHNPARGAARHGRDRDCAD